MLHRCVFTVFTVFHRILLYFTLFLLRVALFLPLFTVVSLGLLYFDGPLPPSRRRRIGSGLRGRKHPSTRGSTAPSSPPTIYKLDTPETKEEEGRH